MARDPRGAKPYPIKTASPLLRALLETADLCGVSHAELAVRTNYSAQSFASWRRGRCEPTVMAIEAVADALGYRLELVRNQQ